MFIEFENVRQDCNSFRRLFSDQMCDVYLWYDNRINRRLIGFQIVYDSSMDLKALTWTEEKGFFHLGVDEDKKVMHPQTPILVEDGIFEFERVKDLINSNLRSSIDKDLQFALEKIRKYGEEKII